MPDWPHSPTHRLDTRGTFMVTSGTNRKEPYFNSRSRLNLLQACLFTQAQDCGASLQAWAIFPNHYHFIASFPEAPKLRALVRSLHSITAKAVNAADASPGRKVWFQYWESRLTFERSYFARLRYVHENAVRHGIVAVATNYDWCSAGWFERSSRTAFRKTILSFRCEGLQIPDQFEITKAAYLEG
jgi:REP-associated tyrosine transposase